MIGDNYEPVKIQGDNSTVEFSFDFPIIAEENLKVYSEDVDTGVQTLITTGITIEFDDSVPAGTVTFDEAPTDEEYVVIGREISPTQTVDYKTSSGFQGSVIMRSFDKLTLMIQDVIEAATRAIKLPLGSDANVILPTPNDKKAIVWDGISGKMKNSKNDVDDIDSIVAAAQAAQAGAEAALAAALVAKNAAEAAAEITRYPVGSVIALGVSTHPATLFGYGTWTQIEGETIVGYKSGDADFGTLDASVGSKTHTLTIAEIPSHTHTIPESGNSGSSYVRARSDASANGHSAIISNATGGGEAHNNIQPSRVKYIWERTA